jgi:DnaJ-class molecular chaperone
MPTKTPKKCAECDGEGGHVHGWDVESYDAEACEHCHGSGRCPDPYPCSTCDTDAYWAEQDRLAARGA